MKKVGSMYGYCSSCVEVSGCLSERFKIILGVCQGLSMLFNVFIDGIFLEIRVRWDDSGLVHGTFEFCSEIL